MIISKLVIGKKYRHRESGYFATFLAILPPKNGENINTFTVVKCGWTQSPEEDYIWIKYFKPSALEEIT